MSIQTEFTISDSPTSEAKTYEPYKLPPRERPAGSAPPPAPRGGEAFSLERELGRFAEIEVAGSDNGTAVRGDVSVSAAPSPRPPLIDEKRRVFFQMRQIAREDRFLRINHNTVFYRQNQRAELALLFYRQADLLKDFEDDYGEQAEFSTYYPYYQLMNYEQFRTYFTWRAGVRKGGSVKISLSYAYLYIYELLNNIGVGPLEGLERLMAFWTAYREYDMSLDKYVLRWLKDYHVYYGLEKSFEAFISERDIYMHYPEAQAQAADTFERYCALSKYDIKHSVFFTEATRELIGGCFSFVVERLAQALERAGLSLDALMFRPAKNAPEWIPFEGALFCRRHAQRDRSVTLFGGETYICRQDKWSRSSPEDGNRRFAGYLLKQTEAALRKITGFKRRLAVNSDVMDGAAAEELRSAGISAEKLVNAAVAEYYAEINRTVVSVDTAALERIRREALDIQEKLIVRGDEEAADLGRGEVREGLEASAETTCFSSDTAAQKDGADVRHAGETSSRPSLTAPTEPAAVQTQIAFEADGEKDIFARSLTGTEFEALALILSGGDINAFAVAAGVMPEVLIDGINQKAYDALGDTVLEFDGAAAVYGEYTDILEAMIWKDKRPSASRTS